MSDDGDVRERTPEEKLKSLLRRDGLDEEIRTVAERALQKRQDGEL